MELQFQAIVLIRTLVKFQPTFLSGNVPLVQALLDVWRSPERERNAEHEEKTPFPQLRQSKYLIECFLNFCEHSEEVNLLYDITSIFTVKTIIDYSFLRDYYLQHIPEKFSVERKKKIVRAFLDFFASQASQEHKVQSLQMLVLPILEKSLPKKENVIDKEVSFRYFFFDFIRPFIL
jgi:transformation/transcription domain-associated protein